MQLKRLINIVELEGVSSKFVNIEYLKALYLTAFRDKDIIRIKSLLNKANEDSLLGVIQRFDNDQNNLHEKYKRVLAGM